MLTQISTKKMTTIKIYKDLNKRLMQRIEELKQKLEQNNCKIVVCKKCYNKSFKEKYNKHREFERQLIRLNVTPEDYWNLITEHFYSNPF